MRLIDAEEMRNRLVHHSPFVPFDVIKEIDNCSTIDQMKHGHWYMEYESHGIFRCSACEKISARVIERTEYCAYCGAKMDDVINDESNQSEENV